MKILILVDSSLRRLFCILFFIILVSFLIPVLHNTYDFSILIPLINQFVNIVVVMLLISLADEDTINFSVLDIVLYCFAFQSIIMLMSLLSTTVYNLVQLTQDEGAIELSISQYGGYRNLGIGSSQFFYINAAFGIALIIEMFSYITTRRKKYLYLFVITLFGLFVTGRSALLAVFLSFAIFFYDLFLRNKVGFIFKIPFYLFICIIIILLFYNFLPEFLKNWVFEVFINYEKTGKFSSSSSDKLLNDMFFVPDIDTIVFGDGYYMDPLSDAYYGKTDSGYMRMILFYGVGGVLMYFYYLKSLLKSLYKNLSSLKVLSVSMHKILKTTVIFIFLYVLVLHVKGEILGFLISVQVLLYTWLILSVLNKYKK